MIMMNLTWPKFCEDLISSSLSNKSILMISIVWDGCVEEVSGFEETWFWIWIAPLYLYISTSSSENVRRPSDVNRCWWDHRCCEEAEMTWLWQSWSGCQTWKSMNPCKGAGIHVETTTAGGWSLKLVEYLLSILPRLTSICASLASREPLGRALLYVLPTFRERVNSIHLNPKSLVSWLWLWFRDELTSYSELLLRSIPLQYITPSIHPSILSATIKLLLLT